MPRSEHIRVKAMVILLDEDGVRQAVARLRPTAENPDGYDRLIGGHIEPGESAVEAIRREVTEELGADLVDAELLDVVENLFRINGSLGHEVVFVFGGRLARSGVIPPEGAMFSDDDDPMPVWWRPLEDAALLPLYPPGSTELAVGFARGERDRPVVS